MGVFLVVDQCWPINAATVPHPAFSGPSPHPQCPEASKQHDKQPLPVDGAVALQVRHQLIHHLGQAGRALGQAAAHRVCARTACVRRSVWSVSRWLGQVRRWVRLCGAQMQLRCLMACRRPSNVARAPIVA